MAYRTLRVAGGVARGIPLASPRGLRLRPTAARVREAIFNILADQVAGASVLDLYAGTGALGIEALSRGASSALFIEGERATVQAILENLSRTGLADRGKVLRGRLPAALGSIEGSFDLIFLDPPYADSSIEETLLDLPRLLERTGTVVYEHASRYNPPERPAGLRLVRRRPYGDTAVAFYQCQEGS